jgi:hypothetical protein
VSVTFHFVSLPLSLSLLYVVKKILNKMALASLGPIGQEKEMNQYYYISELVCVIVCEFVV